MADDQAADDQTETDPVPDKPVMTEIRRAHEWVPPRRDQTRGLPICRICGAVKRSGLVLWCYVEEIETDVTTS